jgi:hypothetical protein
MHLTNTALGRKFTVDAIRLIGGKRLMLKTPKAQGE